MRKTTKRLLLFTVVLLVIPILISSCDKGNKAMAYKVKRADKSFNLNDKWDQGQWAKTEPLQLNYYMGDKPQHFPKTQAKLLYDTENIYVFFRVEDRYVRAVAEKYHDSVCQDSCVEFFFTPGKDISKGYFNAEINCCGVILMAHQITRGNNIRLLATEDCDRIKITPSMDAKVIDPEITEPKTWTVQYSIPFDTLKKYSEVEDPKPGTIWKANFYKCADKTSRPHWLTWNLVEKPEPDFHLPEYFGIIEFE